MSTANDGVQGLDDCGCGGGTGQQTPATVQNRPGLPAVAYRVGTHATFRATALAALSSASRPALRGLSARDDDFTSALIDAWAAVGDVLTFYQERIANESYLRTATERRSVLELARAVGYELAPGLAASTPLAFTLEDAPGAPAEVTLKAGTRVQSVPGPGERPQTFETVEEIAARPGWNALRPRLTRPQSIGYGARSLLIAGSAALVAVGDAVLLVGSERRENAGSERWDLRVVSAVERDVAGNRTRIRWKEPLGSAHPFVSPAAQPSLFVFRQRAAFFGHNAPDWKLIPEQARVLYSPNDPDVGDWPGFEPPYTVSPAGVVEADLDAVYPRVLAGGWVVFASEDYRELYRVVTASHVARVGFALTAKVTRLRLDTDENLARFTRRETVVFADAEELPLAEEDVPDPVEGSEVELGAKLEALAPGRRVLVRGKRARVRVEDRAVYMYRPSGEILKVAAGSELLLVAAGTPGAPVATAGGDVATHDLLLRDEHGREGTANVDVDSTVYLPAHPDDPETAELATVLEVRAADPEHPVLLLTAPLGVAYDRPTVVIEANVAMATHGEAVTETLGSGDAAREYQRFALRQAPLTFVSSAEAAGGAASTLEVRVAGVRWDPVPTLYGERPRDRVYTVRLQDDASTLVQFGDGETGARLPTGRENVQAVYRKGIGRVGNVRAGQLSLLMTRELGLRGVANPLAASGGQDPESMDDARANAPRTVLTLDRVVSLRDYEEFARTFAGVSKALAVWTWDAGRRGVHLTVAGPDGEAVAGAVHDALLAALAGHGDAYVPARVESYRPVLFHLAATLRADPDRLPGLVKADVEAALRDRFAFGRRDFGQRVALSEVVSVIQAVPGVAAVDLDRLHREDEAPRTAAYLTASAPQPGVDALVAQPAELLLLGLGPDDLTVTP
ncbi:MAG TPA: putative baseplate assembly protein [Longimicrobium sp.]|nr:putative baseplate assembly protein [Longimicrobium sp.]